MRLTLRTLLDYLDDTLDTAQVKKIGQKVAESDTAQELIARIKQVTRRRRLTVPSEGGDGGLDANKIAEYLDNAMSEDDVAEVEQICLGSDVQLAEVAACHQIQTLVQGEPILIPPTSRQRMYGLAKGKEAIHFRKPPAEEEQVAEREELYEADETLRMGIPAFSRSSWTSRLLLIGGSLAACALLVLAIYQALQVPGGPVDQDVQTAKNGVADKSKKDKKQPEDDKGADTKGTTKNGNGKVVVPGKKNGEKPEDKGGKSKKDNGTEPKKKDPVTPDDKKKKDFPDVPMATPGDKVEQAGRYRITEHGLLLQQIPKKMEWQHIKAMQPVYSSATLVSLPGFKSEVQTKNGLELTLWGLQPEQVFFQTPLLESAVILHPHEKIDLDLTFLRGRIVITNPKDTPAHVRLRFANPTNPEKKGIWDIVLKSKGSEILAERWTAFPSNEPYYADPKHPDRRGPMAFQHLLVMKGKVDLKERDLVTALEGPPSKKAYVYWDSYRGAQPPQEANELPPWATGAGRLPEDMTAEDRKTRFEMKTKMEDAAEKFSGKMATSAVEDVLTSFLKSEDSYERFLALRSYTALGNLAALIDAMSNPEPKRADVRRGAIAALKRWLSYERDNDYKLYDALLEQKFAKLEAHDIMYMMHSLPIRDVYDDDTYRLLVRYLNSTNLATRELAGWQLYFELPRYFDEELAKTAAKIEYDPIAPEAVRQNAQMEWRQLIDDGKLPPKVRRAPPQGQ